MSLFTAQLPVDQDGLVLDYPDLFRRTGTWSLDLAALTKSW
ncbi:MAG: putative glycolipid-binding domain-containing protein [Ktedonobacteraceae bacterium]|nr:putative glycolipid-binding domain-containing protein [Ktedonobacteraceae bacterium]